MNIKITLIAIIICTASLLTVAFSGCENRTDSENCDLTEEVTTEAVDTLPTTIPSTQITTESYTEDVTTQEITNRTEKVTYSQTTTTLPPSTTQPIETTTFMVAPDYTPEQEVIDIYNAINNYREENGLDRLVLDKELCGLAYVRTQEQEQIEGHTRPNGKPSYNVADEYGYERRGLGENIAIIPSTIDPGENCEKIINAWKDSPSHNRNILKNKWIKTGIALYTFDDGRYAIVQLFAY